MSEKDRTEGHKYLTKHLNAYIGRGAKRFHTMIPAEFQDIQTQFQPYGSIDPYDRQVRVEESVDISMRESDYQRLLDVLGYIQHHGNADFYKQDLEERVAFERSLRDKHPGIKKAYERYRILLEMVAQGKEIED